ncbi:hypothetical protein MNBD_GAMMA08-432, partial [hydrothermal vent metagenome]
MKTKTRDKSSIKNNAIHNAYIAITINEGVEKYLEDLSLKNYSEQTIY